MIGTHTVVVHNLWNRQNLTMAVIHRDNETDLTINHLTTSPVTNHVCEVQLYSSWK